MRLFACLALNLHYARLLIRKSNHATCRSSRRRERDISTSRESSRFYARIHVLPGATGEKQLALSQSRLRKYRSAAFPEAASVRAFFPQRGNFSGPIRDIRKDRVPLTGGRKVPAVPMPICVRQSEWTNHRERLSLGAVLLAATTAFHLATFDLREIPHSGFYTRPVPIRNP